MRINRAIGLGIAILVFQWLVGSVFVAVEDTAITALNFTQAALGAAEVGLTVPTTEIGASLLPR